jgi:hypothetical protein
VRHNVICRFKRSRAAPLASEDKRAFPELGKCDCRFACYYWLPYTHVISTCETLGEIEEPDWKDLAEQFDESGFEIYTSQALVKVGGGSEGAITSLEAKLVTSEALESVRTRSFLGSGAL